MPDAEVKFHGLTLRSARQNARLNEVELDFASPVDGALFDQMAKALPDWVEFALCQ